MLFDATGRPLEIASDGSLMTFAFEGQTISITNPCVLSCTLQVEHPMLDVSVMGEKYRRQMPALKTFRATLEIVGTDMVAGYGNVFEPFVSRLTVLELLKITREKIEKR